MELKGACSNPRLQDELPRIASLHAGVLRDSSSGLLTPAAQKPRIGGITDAVTTVLRLAAGPMRASDVHRAAEELTGLSIKLTTVKATLATHSSGVRPRFVRVGYGRYEITGRGAGQVLRENEAC